ncbi:MAG: leucine-rich repeat protein, partial [Gammaproteobacteria bacterium]|nr:leucine-rich repeat protein [Gammaproteobacteria bacterium]
MTGLNLRTLGLQRLPPDIFRSLAGLENLDLSGNDHLTELPARLLADLERPPAVTAGFDSGVRIGGVQHRLGGETVTELALDEKEIRNIRIEVAGGVHSTLTLVARTDGAPPPIVTPAIIRFSPFSGADAVAVDVTAPKDSNFESSTGSVSWAWTMFNAAGATTEIRTPGLRLNVRELDIFEDSNPAPNQISEAAAVGAVVSGWSPQVRVDGVIEPAVSYALQPDADPGINNLFRIDSATGALSLAAERALNHAMSSSRQITVVAEVTDSGVTATLAVAIEVTPGFVIRDADPSVNIIAATAAQGTPVGGLAVVARVGSTTLTSGVLYSLDGPGLFEVNRASGRVSAARPITNGDIGPHTVTMTASHNRSVWSLPLTIEVRDGISICSRTRQIRNAIVELINNRRRSEGVTYNCHAVLSEDLASVGTLNIAGRLAGVTALLAHDFNGMSALQTLDLSDLEAATLPEDIFGETTNLRVLSLRGIFGRDSLMRLPSNIFRNLGQLQNLDLSFTRLETLPEDIFRDTANLNTLDFSGSGLTSLPPDILMNLDRLASLGLAGNNNLTELPARLLADIEKTQPSFSVNAGVRIGGIQYLAGGVSTMAVTLNEGDDRDLQVEVVGGVRSTLTLVFRSSAESRFTATPATVQFSPSRRSVAVTLAVPVDPNLGDRSGPAWWEWTSSGSLGGAPEVRAPDLQVTVNDTHRFEDADPAPNEISETASAGAMVSGWAPQVVVGGVASTNVRYSLSPDAGGLFEIDAMSGTLSLASGRTLDYETNPAHQITVIARLTDSGTMASLAVTIEVTPELLLRDADPSANSIAATAATGTPVVGAAPEARFAGDILTDGVTYTLAGSGLFTVSPTSGVISAARLLTESDIGEYPVTVTARCDASRCRDFLASLPLTIDIRPGVSICDRTPAIRDEIVRLVSSPEARYDCRFVPSDRLASISTLNLSRRLGGVTALLAHDLDGMTGLEYLNLRENSRLASLPARLLANLEKPQRVTAGFDAGVRIGGIQYLVDGVATTGPLTLDEGDSLNLRVGVTAGVYSTLTLVFRADGAPFTATPAAVELGPFSNTNTAVVELTALPDLNLADSDSQVSWAWEMFDSAAGGTTGIRAQNLRMNVRNTETFSFEDADLSPNTIAVPAAQGTNVTGVAPTVRVGGVVVTTDVAYTLTGSVLFAVHSTSGAIFSTRPVTDGDRGHHLVALTASYRSGAGSLPLVIGVHPAGGFDVCDRTSVVQQEILRRVNAGGSSHICSNIPAASLASVQTLDFSGYPATVETLLVHDLEGLSGLASLNLDSLGLRRLPPGIFSGLTNLQALGLQRNGNLELPAQAAADLERLRPSEVRLDSGIRIGGVQYRLDGETITGLTLAERESRNLRVEIDGGVRSALTLAVRTDGAQPVAVTPTTIRFGPPSGADAAVVELTIPEDDNFESSTGSVSWAWTMFNRGGGEAAEIRTQALPVNGRELDRFEDIAPAANRISEAASPRDLVVGWSPRVLVDGVTETSVRYSLSLDAGGLFQIHPTSGALSLAPGRTLDYAISPSHEITAVAEVVASRVRASLAATIEVVPLPVIRDADSSSANVIAVNAARGTPVEGFVPEALSGSEVVTGSVVWSLAGGGGLFTVNPASGVISAARQIRDGDIGMHPVTVRAAFNFGVASLPLVIEVGISVCRRTRQVRDEIVLRVNSQPGAMTYNCRVIPPVRLASISTLSLAGSTVSSWWPTDFHGMPGLKNLDLSFLSAVRPPVGQFTALTNVRVLNLERSRFFSLQSRRFVIVSLRPDTFRDMHNLENLNLEGSSFDPSTPDVFMNLGRLQDLNLGALGPISLPEGIFRSLANLRVLSLEGSPSTLTSNIFTNLGNLQELNLAFALATTSLPEAIFSGLSNLRELNLSENDSLTSLPPDIFMSLGSLERLNLSLNFALRELPARLLANLERPVPVIIGFDRHVRIGGIQYLLNGATTTALTLNEGGSRNLRVEVVGGIGSALTLAFRTSDESRFTAMPSTLHFTSSRRSADVTLSVPPDLSLGDRSGPASWVWTGFDSLGGPTEVRAPDLQVTVRDTHRLEDADSAPNRIGETAPAGVAVSGWSPRVLVGGVVQTTVRYSLPSDAGGLFQIHPETGVLSLVSGGTLDYAASSSHEVTVEAAASGVTASLAATIEVFTLALEDADPAANTIAVPAPRGTPVSGVDPVLLVDGVAIEDNIAYTLAGPDFFTVNAVSGEISSGRPLTGGDSGSWPVTLTATYQGTPADLPLTITIPAGSGLFICDRTVAVQEEILRRVNSQTEVQNRIATGNPPYSCNDVPAANMALVQLLDLSAYPTTVTTLLAHDFERLPGLTGLMLDSLGLESLPPTVFGGLSNLENLSLSDNSLTSLPPDIFSGLSSLRVLDLSGNDHLELPAQAAADLEGLRLMALEVERDVRIGGFEYHPGIRLIYLEGEETRMRDESTTVPFPIFGEVQTLLLDEQQSYRLRVRIAGGVRSTLTLILRVDGDQQFTVTPTTVRFSPLSNTDTAVVELTALAYETVGRDIARMSWAWTMFDSPDGAVTEIRTQRLQVEVNDDSGLVDTDPADNRISEAASAGVAVSGWSPQVLLGGVTATNVRYRLLMDAGGLFQIHPTSGTLSLVSGRMLDYETSSVHTVRVAGQAHGETEFLTTAILVDNAPELSLSGVVTGSISETAATGTAVSGIGVSLLDDGVSRDRGIVYALEGESSQTFALAVSGNVAGLQLANAPLNYGTTPVYTLTLRATYLGASITTQITVNVLDVLEAVTLEAVGLLPYQVREDAVLDMTIGAVTPRTETGAGLAQGVSYTQAGSELFAVTTAGDIVVAGQLDFEASTSHTLFITASYEGVDSNQLRVDIVVVDRANDLQIVDQSSAENIASNT